MAANTKMNPTLMRMKSNHGADHHDLQFSQRDSLSDAMCAGCRAATRGVMTDFTGVFDLGLGEPVTVDPDGATRGKVAEALGMIVYRDEDVDSLFFVYRSKRGYLCAVLGGGQDMARAFDGWLDFRTYMSVAWDSHSGTCLEVFAVNDLKTLWSDVDGVIAGADIDGAVVTVTRDHIYESYARVPEPVLMRIAAQSAVYSADKAAQRGAFSG